MTIQEMIDSGANVQVVVNLLDLKEYGRSLIEETKKTETPKPDERISQKEVCEILHKDISTIIRYEKSGYLVPVCRIGKTPYYLRSQIDKMFNSK